MVVAHTQALLVPAKLTPPQPLTTWVLRERLLNHLDAAQTRLTLVVAPAGFGKSTLVGQWLQLRAESGRQRADAAEPLPSAPGPQPIRFAWLTLDEHDQEALSFLAYLVGAIDRVRPDVLAATHDILAAPEPPPYMVLQALLVDLSALDEGLTIILDDYHMVTAEAVHKVVAYLLRHMPPLCRLALLSRVDPPLPLARLRAEQQVTDIRAADLRFTAEETGTLLAKLLGAAPDAATRAALLDQTEGWVIALQLAAMAHLESRAPGARRDTATRQIAEYLADEVFNRQPPEIQQVLLALATPERFCAGLCAALLDTPEDLIRAESLLDQLNRSNLFLTPLDEEGCWYRFHHLFRDLLLRRLRLTVGKGSVTALQLRAGLWLEQAGLVEEATRHYLAAGAEDTAAELIERQLLPKLDKNMPEPPPAHWLRMLPAELVARRPGLALVVAPPSPQPALPEMLTRREFEILALLAERWSDKEIAEQLMIAPNTVRKHTSTIYDKLGVASRREAVETARALGLLPVAGPVA